MSELREAWRSAVLVLGGAGEPAEITGADLEERYAEPHRRYHRAEHIAAVLQNSAKLATAEGLDAKDRAALVLAVCAHDVIYDGRPGADERASAAWAHEVLSRCGLPPQIRDQVSAAVVATMTHTTSRAAPLIAALLDADLAILATPAAVYDRYVAAVRAEYANLDEDTWRQARRQLLSLLGDRDRLFVTDEGHRRWERAARANVDRELSLLRTAT